MIKAIRTLLTVTLLGVWALASFASPAVAGASVVKLTLNFTDVNPLTGEATGDPDATGTAVLKFHLNSEKLCYRIKVRGLEKPTEPGPGVGDGHIHLIPTGAIVVDLDTDFQRADGFFIATGCVSVSEALLADILADPTEYYLNIHNSPYPGGALFALL